MKILKERRPTEVPCSGNQVGTGGQLLGSVLAVAAVEKTAVAMARADKNIIVTRIQ